MAFESYTEKIACKNGATVLASEAVLPVEDMGIVHGVSVTEMLRTFHGQPFEVAKHLKRLFHSAKLVGIPIAYSVNEICEQLQEVVSHNQSLLSGQQEQGVIIFATPGLNATYTGQIGKLNEREPTLMIHTFTLQGELWEDAIKNGQHLAISTVPMIPEDSVPANAKSRSRLSFYLADQEVQHRFPGSRAILLNQAGSVRETSTANLFVVKDNQIWTAARDTVLPGISREVTIEIAEKMGIKVIEKDFSPQELLTADEVFTTSTPYCLIGVSKINGQQIATVYPGKITASLLEKWNKLVKTNIHLQLKTMSQK